MKITFFSYVFPHPNPGFNPGIERVIGELAPAIAAKGHEVTVISSFRNGVGPLEEMFGSVRLLRIRDLRASIGKVSSIGSIDFVSLYFQAERRLSGLFDDSAVVHAFAPVYRWPFSTPLVSHFHHFDAPRTLVEFAYARTARLLWTRTYERSEVVVAVSKHSAQEFANVYGTVGTSVRVIHNGVNTAKFGVRLPLARRRRRLLFVGPLILRKGLAYLVAAFARVAEDLDLHLDIVGSGEQRRDLAKLARELGVEDRIVFHGFLGDDALVRMYQSSFAFVLPSLQEGYGLVAAEAMAAGLPVIASNSTAIPEVVGDAGLLVEPANVDELADAIRKLCTDEHLHSDLSIRAHERAINKLSWDRVAGKMTDLYFSLAPQQ